MCKPDTPESQTSRFLVEEILQKAGSSCHAPLAPLLCNQVQLAEIWREISGTLAAIVLAVFLQLTLEPSNTGQIPPPHDFPAE